MTSYTEEKIVEIALQLSPSRRARFVDTVLKSLGNDEADAGWIEELRWQLKDWRAGVRFDAVEDFLDDPKSVLRDHSAHG
jgi:hypothetical protein